MASKKTTPYEEITRQIIADLEKGVATWTKPWDGAGGFGMPRNGATKRPYSGINVLILMNAQMQNGWRTPQFLTFKQARTAGGNVKKGSKGTRVVFVGRTAKENDNGEEVFFKFLKTFTLFNVDQCENLPAKITDWQKPEPLSDEEFIRFIENTGATVQHGIDRAFYSPSLDYIGMPHHSAFRGEGDYKATLLHELTHWTNHKSRLDRKFGVSKKGNKAYAREELVAELGAAFLCADLGVAAKLQHSEYIASWLKVLKDDPRALMNAASHASKAAQYIHSLQQAAAIKDAA